MTEQPENTLANLRELISMTNKTTNLRPKPLDPLNEPRYKGGIELPPVTDTSFWNGLLLQMSDDDKIDLLREIIEDDFGGNAAAFARHKEINKGLVSRALNRGYIAPALSRAMGWPLTAPAPVCPTHGTVHCWDCQTQSIIEKPAETKRINRKPQIRLAATVTEEQRQVLNKLAAARGLTWSQYCQDRANRLIKEGK